MIRYYLLWRIISILEWSSSVEHVVGLNCNPKSLGLAVTMESYGRWNKIYIKVILFCNFSTLNVASSILPLELRVQFTLIYCYLCYSMVVRRATLFLRHLFMATLERRVLEKATHFSTPSSNLIEIAYLPG